jgi:tRNA (guanine37-N1)-methyltransferase
MKFHVLTLFPDMFSGPLSESIIGRGIAEGLLQVHLHNIRDFARDRHRTVDDAPYGGGSGMVMKAEPLLQALEAARADSPGARVLLASPRGAPLTQRRAAELARERELIIVCGRYEGVDERFRLLAGAEEVSIGDYVLTGGELAALVVIDAVGRLVPGVLGSADSADEESFTDGLLEYPQYTRPPRFRDLDVPEVLLSGNHRLIARWRRQQSLLLTRRDRPDLWHEERLDKLDRQLLADADREELA